MRLKLLLAFLPLIATATSLVQNNEFETVEPGQYHDNTGSIHGLINVVQPIHRIPRPIPRPTRIRTLDEPSTTEQPIIETTFIPVPTQTAIPSVRPGPPRPSLPIRQPLPRPRPTKIGELANPEPVTPALTPDPNFGRYPYYPRPFITPRPGLKPTTASEPIPEPEPVPEPIPVPIPEPVQTAKPEIEVGYNPRPNLPPRPILRPRPAPLQPQPVPEPIPVPEPTSEPTPEPKLIPEPIPEPIPVPIPEPVQTAKPEIKAEYKPKPYLTPRPILRPRPAPQQPQPVPEPIPVPEPVPEPIPEPESIPEPVPNPVPIPIPDPVQTAKPEIGTGYPRPNIMPRPIPRPRPAPLRPQPVPIPVPQPVQEPNLVPEPVPEPNPLPEVVPEPIPLPEPIPEPIPEPEPVPEPKPAPLEDLDPEPQPLPIPQPQPLPSPQPVPVPQPNYQLRRPQPTPVYLTTTIKYWPTAGTLRPAPRPVVTPQPNYRPSTPYNPPSPTVRPLPQTTPKPYDPSRIPSPNMMEGIPIDYKCVQDGYYGIANECDTYIECRKRVALKYMCPDGLRFNPNTFWPEYPCAYPTEVQCDSKAVVQQPQPTSQCPRQYGYFSMNDGDCSRYIMCQAGVAVTMDCPAGLAFDPVQGSCDWPENVPSCRPNVFQGFTCPSAPVDEFGEPIDWTYKYRYGQSCKQYVACHRGSPRLLSCDPGLAFDEASESCIDSDYVLNCKGY